MTSKAKPVWFITGCSSGFGHELARLLIARGFRVVATARDKSRLADLVGSAEDRVLSLDLDVTDLGQIKSAVAAAEQRFGAIDVLVNNAGYGYQVAAEEGDEAEIRDVFEANVFGVFALTRAVLPGMRARRKGHVINITSTAGHLGLAGSGYYSATKHAVEGFSQALRREVKPLGIAVTAVAPGPFRTDFAGRSLHQAMPRIADYDVSVGERLKQLRGRSGTQQGDPARAAALMIQLTETENPPGQIVLGESGLDAVVKALNTRLAEIEKWRDQSVSTDFPAE